MIKWIKWFLSPIVGIRTLSFLLLGSLSVGSFMLCKYINGLYAKPEDPSIGIIIGLVLLFILGIFSGGSALVVLFIDRYSLENIYEEINDIICNFIDGVKVWWTSRPSNTDKL